MRRILLALALSVGIALTVWMFCCRGPGNRSSFATQPATTTVIDSVDAGDGKPPTVPQKPQVVYGAKIYGVEGVYISRLSNNLFEWAGKCERRSSRDTYCEVNGLPGSGSYTADYTPPDFIRTIIDRRSFVVTKENPHPELHWDQMPKFRPPHPAGR